MKRDAFLPVRGLARSGALFSFDERKNVDRLAAKPLRLKFVKGQVGAEGFAVGASIVFAPLLLGDLKVCKTSRPLTMADFQRGVALSEKELHGMHRAVAKKLPDVVSLIFSAQIMMLKDRTLLGAVEALIGRGIAPQEAVRDIVEDYVARFDSMANEYVREKRYDVIDVGRRILANMIGSSELDDRFDGKIVIARELLPSDIMKLSLQNAAGIILLSGGVTAHVAVLARSVNIPLVIANEPRLMNVKNGSCILLDGAMGNISIDPDSDVVRAFRSREASRLDVKRILKTLREETRTKDGVRIVLLANINLLADLAVAKAFKAEGVGLYRSEFPFLLRGDFPSEEEQYVIYRRLVEGMKGREITFRTLDVGGDKMLSYYDGTREANPFLGLRSIRFSLKNRDIFAHQIRAILRAGFDADLRIMFPMISSVDEFVAAREMVAECSRALHLNRRPYQRKPRIGAMIEVPSILAVIEELASTADFLSIGTNDLIQYMLAVDRTNEKVAEFYFPHHPAVLRGIKRVVDAASLYQRDISICGDMAHDPRYIPFFIGIGVRKFSLDASYLPKIQHSVNTIDTRKATLFAADLLTKSSVTETAELFDR
ncbi:MAG: phosphoenolpyruvate--protein phosphotransferase [Candidatus Omnitrophica bacterium]|nr:phosphoenolpyruvate--protein phosphotransferase [Candidatus Omnitrophota bacterium]